MAANTTILIKEEKGRSSKNDHLNETKNDGTPIKEWNNLQKISFRTAFIFFILMSIPTSESWYRHLVSIDWTSLHYRDLYDLARFSSGFRFAGNTIFGNSLLGYASWVNTLLVSVLGGLLWTFIDKKLRKEPSNYANLYYWLRVIVRYRAGIGIIGFGFTKLLPVQMPYPSEGLLNTNFGDFTAQKIFWLSIGIVPWFQVYTGILENLAGTLLFFRKTAALGAALLIGALGTITYVNFAYEGGVHGYASYFVLLGGFILAHYVPSLYKLFILEQKVIPNEYYPSLDQPWQKYSRIALKSAVIAVFLVWLFYIQFINYLYDPYKQPSTSGVAELRGYYEVEDFRLNGKQLPYSPLDSLRWQEVTFENWSTLTFKVNKAIPVDLSNGGGSPMRDINRTFEIAGVGGGRRAFYYEADTVQKILYLQDKNVAGLGFGRRNRNAGPQSDPVYPENWISEEAKANIGDEYLKIQKTALTTRRKKEMEEEKKWFPNRKKMVLRYNTVDRKKIILEGTNDQRDSVYVVLKKIDRKYALSKGKIEAGKYD